MLITSKEADGSSAIYLQPTLPTLESLFEYPLDELPIRIVDSVRDHRGLQISRVNFEKLVTQEKIIVFKRVVAYFNELINQIPSETEYERMRKSFLFLISMYEDDALGKAKHPTAVTSTLFEKLLPNLIFLENWLSPTGQSGKKDLSRVTAARVALGIIV